VGVLVVVVVGVVVGGVLVVGVVGGVLVVGGVVVVGGGVVGAVVVFVDQWWWGWWCGRVICVGTGGGMGCGTARLGTAGGTDCGAALGAAAVHGVVMAGQRKCQTLWVDGGICGTCLGLGKLVGGHWWYVGVWGMKVCNMCWSRVGV